VPIAEGDIFLGFGDFLSCLKSLNEPLYTLSAVCQVAEDSGSQVLSTQDGNHIPLVIYGLGEGEPSL
jgi:hypothetical protein